MQPLRIGIERLKVTASVGIYAGEKKKKQTIYISAAINFRHKNYDVDRMESSLDYDLVCAEIRKVTAERHYELIENLALNIAQALKKIAHCDKVEIRIDKPLAAKKNRAESIWVQVEL